jgi:phage terminase large subunit/TM2 domain-containing membrane protein YozV
MDKVKIKVSEPFKLLYKLPEGVDFVICIGGRGGMKTYEVSKFAAVQATVKRRRVGVFRDEATTIRESILNEIFQRYDRANVYGGFDGIYEKIQNGIRDLETGDLCVFTKGFRASSLEKKANLKGVSEVDTAIVEEAEDIRSFDKFNTFRDSIRTKERLIVVLLNTPDIQHWIVRRYFNLEAVDYVTLSNGSIQKVDGYWKLVPKDLKGFACIQTSYKDNSFLPENVVRDYENYGNPEHPNFDLHYYLTAILGYASSGRKGQVLTKVKPIKLADYLALQLPERFGVDFGTSAPAGIPGVKIDGNRLYARELLYAPTDTLNIAAFFRRLQLTDNDVVIADSADPLSIGKLRRGFNYDPQTGKDELTATLRREFPNGIKGLARIYGAIKGAGSIEFGIGLLTGMELYFVDDYPIDPKLGTTNLWNEVYNYIYAVNKEGEPTNDPIDGYNHLIDPIRYVKQSQGRFF